MLDQMTACDLAHMLRVKYGDEAVNVVTNRERVARESGREDEAEDWERVRKILRDGRAPPRS